MSLAWIKFLVFSVYATPSVILYCLTFFIIFSNKKLFDSSFFQLYIFDGFANIFTFLVCIIQVRLISITQTGTLLASFYLYIGTIKSFNNFLAAMSFHMAFVQYSTTALISLNRLTVLLSSGSIEQAWRKCTWVVMLLVYILPVISTKKAFVEDTEMIHCNETDSFKYEMPTLTGSIFLILIPFMIITTLLSVGINIASVSIVQSMKTHLRQKVETNFLIIMVLTCLVQVLGAILSVSILLTNGLPLCDILTSVLPFVSDGLTLIQPWLLFIFSQTIRKKITQLLGGNPNQSSSRVIRSITW